MNEKSVLLLPRLPARLDLNQAADLLGFMSHEMPILLRAGLLKPLGKPAPNGHKFFSTTEVLSLTENREWLDKATRAIAKHWQEKNAYAKPPI